MDFWERVHLIIWHQYIFSVSLKFGAYYITCQCGAFIKKMFLNAFIYVSDIFLLFFIIKFCVPIIFLYFFDKVSNFRNSVLTNQKRELVISKCKWNCMLVKFWTGLWYLFLSLLMQYKWSFFLCTKSYINKCLSYSSIRWYQFTYCLLALLR